VNTKKCLCGCGLPRAEGRKYSAKCRSSTARIRAMERVRAAKAVRAAWPSRRSRIEVPLSPELRSRLEKMASLLGDTRSGFCLRAIELAVEDWETRLRREIEKESEE
jgi:hypothetical protein